MKRKLLTVLAAVGLLTVSAQAQDQPQREGTKTITDKEYNELVDTSKVMKRDAYMKHLDSLLEASRKIFFPRNMVGIRAGFNVSALEYSSPSIDRYSHQHPMRPGVGVFGHFAFGKTGIAIRPEAALVGRGDDLKWLDVDYRFRAWYLDWRLPITYNIRFEDHYLSPYLMVAPMASVAMGGQVSYWDQPDYPNGVSAPITKADINNIDASVLIGGGVDYLLRTKGAPVMLSLEAGYNVGLRNTFSPREIIDNSSSPSVIGNPFFGAQLYQETRKNRGVEVALRISLPIDNSWKGPRMDPPSIDTLIVMRENKTTDTVYINMGEPVMQMRQVAHNDSEYQIKDCYSFNEFFAFLTLGIDISNKRMCLFKVNFDFDSYNLRPESLKYLDDVVRMMQTFPDINVKVIGHTDSIGSDTYNQRLSSNRAQSVVSYIVMQGIAESRLQSEGWGEQYPLDDNGTDEGRARNRRVEIEIVNYGTKITNE